MQQLKHIHIFLRLVLTLIALCICRSACASDTGIPEPTVNPKSGVKWYRNIRYVEGVASDPTKHVMDIYLPAEDKWEEGKPLVVWFHGGAWISGDKDRAFGIYARYCRKLAEHGIASANVSYRLSPRVKHPAHVKDAAAATVWLVNNAENFGYNRSVIFVSGHSAGGHLAALLATDDNYLKELGFDNKDIAGVVASSGLFDLRLLYNSRFTYWSAFDKSTAKDASPVTHADANDPPMLLIVEEHGEFMREQTQLMVDAMVDSGGVARSVTVPEVNHISLLGDLLEENGVHLTETIRMIREIWSDR